MSRSGWNFASNALLRSSSHRIPSADFLKCAFPSSISLSSHSLRDFSFHISAPNEIFPGAHGAGMSPVLDMTSGSAASDSTANISSSADARSSSNFSVSHVTSICFAAISIFARSFSSRISSSCFRMILFFRSISTFVAFSIILLIFATNTPESQRIDQITVCFVDGSFVRRSIPPVMLMYATISQIKIPLLWLSPFSVFVSDMFFD